MTFPAWRRTLWAALRTVAKAETLEPLRDGELAARMTTLAAQPEERALALAAALERTVPEYVPEEVEEMAAAVVRFQEVQNAVDLLTKYNGVRL